MLFLVTILSEYPLADSLQFRHRLVSSVFSLFDANFSTLSMACQHHRQYNASVYDVRQRAVNPSAAKETK